MFLNKFKKLIINKNSEGKKEIAINISKTIMQQIQQYTSKDFKKKCKKLYNQLFQNIKTKLEKKGYKILNENDDIFHIYWDDMEYEKGLLKYQNNATDDDTASSADSA